MEVNFFDNKINTNDNLNKIKKMNNQISCKSNKYTSLTLSS